MVGLFGGAANFPLPSIVSDSKTIAGVFAGSPLHLNELVKVFAEFKVCFSTLSRRYSTKFCIKCRSLS